MIKEFFGCYNLIRNFDDYGIEEDDSFYTNDALNNLLEESSEVNNASDNED